MKNSGYVFNQIKLHAIWALIGALSALVLTLIFNATGLTGLESFRESESRLYSISSSAAILLMMYCFATPLAEEILFRYFLFNFLNSHIKRAAVAIVLTAALFGIYHLHPVQALYAFLMGLVITYSYYRHRILTIPLVVHIAANALAFGYTML